MRSQLITALSAAAAIDGPDHPLIGVLIAANGPVDAASQPVFSIPNADEPEAGWMSLRPDVRLFVAEERAAQPGFSFLRS